MSAGIRLQFLESRQLHFGSGRQSSYGLVRNPSGCQWFLKCKQWLQDLWLQPLLALSRDPHPKPFHLPGEDLRSPSSQFAKPCQALGNWPLLFRLFAGGRRFPQKPLPSQSRRVSTESAQERKSHRLEPLRRQQTKPQSQSLSTHSECEPLEQLHLPA